MSEFSNLFDFFNYIEFCPLCKSRTMTTVSFPSSTICEMDNKELTVIDDKNIPSKIFRIGLFNNVVSTHYSYSSYPEKSQIVIGRQCNKYHFFYNGIANISKSNLIIDNIVMDKYHFIRIHNLIHFTVNGSSIKNKTSVRITTPDFNTREVLLPFVSFNLFSKKKIDAKLRNIQLLV